MPRDVVATKAFNPEMLGTYQLTDKVVEGQERFHNSLYYDSFPALDSFNIITARIFIEEKLMYDIIDIRSYYKMPYADTVRLNEKHQLTEKYIEAGYVVYKETSYDTLLNLEKQDELKFYNKIWYLNHLLDRKDDDEEKSWEVLSWMIKNKDVFSIGHADERDKKKLRRFIISSKENVFPLVSLSDARFHRFVKRGGFRSRHQFKRI
jgi:hypothetical protein